MLYDILYTDMDGEITLNTWDMLFVLMGVVAYVMVLMITQQNMLLVDLAVAALWLVHVMLVLLLTSRGNVTWNADSSRQILKAVNLLNLGASLCALLYHTSVMITSGGGTRQFRI